MRICGLLGPGIHMCDHHIDGCLYHNTKNLVNKGLVSPYEDSKFCVFSKFQMNGLICGYYNQHNHIMRKKKIICFFTIRAPISLNIKEKNKNACHAGVQVLG